MRAARLAGINEAMVETTIRTTQAPTISPGAPASSRNSGTEPVQAFAIAT